MYLFYTPDIETSNCLSEEESGHCVRVLRYGRGDEILLTDGGGTTYRARITNPHPKHCEFEILSSEKQAPTHDFISISPLRPPRISNAWSGWWRSVRKSAWTR